MKKNKKYISHKNLPPRFPLMGTCFWWMFLDYIKAPGWVFGAIGVCLLILWVSYFYQVVAGKEIDVFEVGK